MYYILSSYHLHIQGDTVDNKKFLVEMPKDKYREVVDLAQANGLSVVALARSLLIRATLRPEEFGFVPTLDHAPITQRGGNASEYVHPSRA
jgi:hypothetical protein